MKKCPILHMNESQKHNLAPNHAHTVEADLYKVEKNET